MLANVTIGNKTATAQSSVTAWTAWKKAGHGPSDREVALKIISKHMKIDVSVARESLARSIKKDGAVVSPADGLSFICWDIQVHGGSLIDYNRTIDAILFDVMEQARQIIGAYSRIRVTPPSLTSGLKSVLRENDIDEIIKRRTQATSVNVRGVGRVLVKDLTHKQLDVLIENFISDAVARIAVWREIGLDMPKVRRMLKRLEEQVEERLAA